MLIMLSIIFRELIAITFFAAVSFRLAELKLQNCSIAFHFKGISLKKIVFVVSTAHICPRDQRCVGLSRSLIYGTNILCDSHMVFVVVLAPNHRVPVLFASCRRSLLIINALLARAKNYFTQINTKCMYVVFFA